LVLLDQNELLLRELAGQARTDPLTGLLNRRGFDADVLAFAERVRVALAESDASRLPAVHVSAGVLATRAPSSLETMLQRADAALYQAKRAGRNRTMAFASSRHAGRARVS
jgi:GGDEF domain-containing protein